MKRKTLKCNRCKGVGLIKAKFIECETCEGKKCVGCGERGYIQAPYIECPNCYGGGEITEEEANILKELNRFDDFMNPKLTKEEEDNK